MSDAAELRKKAPFTDKLPAFPHPVAAPRIAFSFI
jgi:hypothetical protein